MAGLLSELALTLLAIGAILLIFALQGFVSAFREGPELHVRRIYPLLTRWRSTTLLIGTLVPVVIAIVLGGGIALGMGHEGDRQPRRTRRAAARIHASSPTKMGSSVISHPSIGVTRGYPRFC